MLDWPVQKKYGWIALNRGLVGLQDPDAVSARIRPSMYYCLLLFRMYQRVELCSRFNPFSLFMIAKMFLNPPWESRESHEQQRRLAHCLSH